MLWLLTRLVVWPLQVAAGSMKVGYKTGRLLGYRRVFVFGAGVAVGLLLAPTTGAALRAKIQSLIDGEDMPNDPVPAEAPPGVHGVPGPRSDSTEQATIRTIGMEPSA